MPPPENGPHPDLSDNVPLVTVIGESLVDIIDDPFRGNTTPETHPGGSPLNVAVGCARLDLPTSLITHFAEDRHGRMIAEHLDSNGVHAIVGGSLPTSTALASLDATGAAQYSFAVTWDINGASIPALAAVESSLHVHTGSIATALPRAGRRYGDSSRRPGPTPPSASTPTAAPSSTPNRLPPANGQKTSLPSPTSSKPATKISAGSTPTGPRTSRCQRGWSSDHR